MLIERGLGAELALDAHHTRPNAGKPSRAVAVKRLV